MGHPSCNSYCSAIANSYFSGAKDSDYDVKLLSLAKLDFNVTIGDKYSDNDRKLESCLIESQNMIKWADHLVIVYPMWASSMPALLKGFFDNIMRPGFSYSISESGKFKGLLGNKSARIITTMAMSKIIYHLFFRSMSFKLIKRGILGACGVRPIKGTFFYNVDYVDDSCRKKWLAEVKELGNKAQ